MVPPRPPYPVTVLGQVAVGYEQTRNVRPLSSAKQHTLAVLVAAGEQGVDASSFRTADESPVSVEALRMAITRLREHLPSGALPAAAGGRYRLVVPDRDVDAWHLAALAAAPLPAAPDMRVLRHLLQPVDPFAPLDDAGSLAAAAEHIRRLQRQLLERLGVERPDLLRGELIEDVYGHLADDPYNERLLLLCGSSLARGGHRRDALNLVARARQEFAGLGLALGPQLAALERALLDGLIPVALDDESAGDRVELPQPLREQLSNPFVGPDDHVAALRRVLDGAPAGACVVATVEGRSGVGKTRACAELARHARSLGWRVLYAAVPSDGGAAFGPMLALFPGLVDPVRRIIDRDLDAETRKAALWSAASRAIGELAGDGRMLLVIDDGQWLDPYTAEFVGHLADRKGDGRLVVLLAGRSDDSGAPVWERIVEGVARRCGPTIAVPPLDRDGLAHLVRTRRPGLSEEQLAAVAADLELSSAGLPGIAAPLVEAIDDVTLGLPGADGVRPGRTLEAAVRLLGDDARTVGGIAAVIGPTFDVSAVSELAPLPVERVLAGIDELVRRGFVVERSVTEFVVVHLLVQSALLDGQSRTRVAGWHQAASARWHDDVHRCARHAAAAVPLVAPDVAARLLERSAHEYLRTGLARSAVGAFRTAEEIGGRLDPSTAGAYARALDLAGAGQQARSIRQGAFDEAMADGSPGVALRVATSGLPEAEPVDGDPTVVASLERVPSDALTDPADRWLHAHHLTRQLALVGRLGDAARAASGLSEAATTADQRVDAALARRLVVSATAPPAERLDRLGHLDDDLVSVDAGRLAGYLVVRAIDRYESADVDGAWRDVERLRAQADELPMWRRWHLALLDAMRSADDGRRAEAKERRRAAFEFAQQRGIIEGTNALLVADFLDLWLDGGAATLRPAVDAGMIDPDASVMMAAGAAVILQASGDPDAAAVHARRVVDAVDRSPVSQGVAAVALVSDVVGETGDRELIGRARVLLEQRSDSLLVVGAGAACLGPIVRYRAALASSGDERVALLGRAVELADRSGLRLWRVVARRDLAHVTGSAVHRAEAAALADGTDAADLVAPTMR